MRVLLVMLVLFFSGAASAQLSGKVTSSEEAAMEGVLVSAKREGSTVTVIVEPSRQGATRCACVRSAMSSTRLWW